MLEFAPVNHNTSCLTMTEATLYCQFLDYNGHRDWRLPSIDELNMIKDYLQPPISGSNILYAEDSDSVLTSIRKLGETLYILPVRDQK